MWAFTFALAGWKAEANWTRSSDAAAALYSAARAIASAPEPTVVSRWFVNAEFYRRSNVDLVMLDYRGYGKSSGQIESEAQLHADVQAVWDSVAARYRGKRVVVYGRSLGTGLAAALAERIAPDLTLLVSPYLSMQALAAQHYPWVPGALLRYPLRTDEAIAHIAGPVLLLHGDRDTLIPIEHSLALARLNPHARLVRIEGAGHGDLQGFEPYLEAVRAALVSVRTASRTAPS